MGAGVGAGAGSGAGDAAAAMVRGSVVVRVMRPPVPVSVMVDGPPRRAVVRAENTIIPFVTPLAIVIAGAVTPLGNPEAVTRTEPVNPLVRVIVMETGVCVPC